MTSALSSLTDVPLHSDSRFNKSCAASEGQRIAKAFGLDPSLAEKIEELQRNAFGAAAWKKVFGVEVENLELSKDFYNFWFGKDALHPHQQNCKTHEYPFLSPGTISKTTTVDCAGLKPLKCSVTTPYNFKTLGELVGKNLEAHIFKKIDKKAKATLKPAYWIVARKELMAKGLTAYNQMQDVNKLNATKHVSYEELPCALDVATVAFIYQVVNKKCYFCTNSEQPMGRSRCKEKISKKPLAPHLDLGCLSDDEHDTSLNLSIGCFKFPFNRLGMMYLQKFPLRPVLHRDDAMLDDCVVLELDDTPGNWVDLAEEKLGSDCET